MIFRLPGQNKNSHLLVNPQGISAPVEFEVDSRRAKDGVIFFGSNRFDSQGSQINDIVIPSELKKNI
jgi:hypothetical protein